MFNEHLLVLASTITGYVSISGFALLVCVPICIMSSVVVIKIFAITEGIKKYISIIQKKKKKHNIFVLLGKSKLNTIEVPPSKDLINHILVMTNLFQ